MLTELPRMAVSFLIVAAFTLRLGAEEQANTMQLRRAILNVETKSQPPLQSGRAPNVSDPQKLVEKYERNVLKLLAEASDHMAKGTSSIAGIEKLIVGHIHLTNATNPWNDVGLRNWYDEVKDWGTIAGSALAAYALAANKGGNRSLQAGGVGLVGLSQLIGRAIGTTGSNRLQEKAAFLDMTVRAYDDLLAHRRYIEGLIDKNSTTRLTRFQKTTASIPKSNDAHLPSTDRLLSYLTVVDDDLAEYVTAIQELLTLSDRLESMAGGYLLSLNAVYNSPATDRDERLQPSDLRARAGAVAARIGKNPATDKALEDLNDLLKSLRDFKKDSAPTIYEFFNVSVDTRTALTTARVILAKQSSEATGPLQP